MSASEKWTKLVRLLLERTNVGSLDWKPTSTPLEFQAVVNRFVVELEGFESHVEFRLRDESGRVIDRFTDADLEEDIFDDPWNPILLRFVEQLNRKASGADEALDKLITDLELDDLI